MRGMTSGTVGEVGVGDDGLALVEPGMAIGTRAKGWPTVAHPRCLLPSILSILIGEIGRIRHGRIRHIGFV